MSVEQLISDLRIDRVMFDAAVAMVEAAERIDKLTHALAHLGCSCTQKTREVDLEAHEIFCRYRNAMEDLT